MHLSPTLRRLFFLSIVPFGFSFSAAAQNAASPAAPPGAAAMLASEKPLEAGAIAPDFNAITAAGKPVHLSDFKKKIVVLDFWATWCAPCQEALPRTAVVARDFPEVVFLGLDTWDAPAAFKEWVARHADLKGMTFATDPTKGGWQIAHSYGVNGIPCQYVIDRDGRITVRLTEPSELSSVLHTLTSPRR